jgi:DNA invertase Pin-like site-specific DNA recombinase
MSKITPLHLERTAYIYVRQSTQGQVHGNLESQRRQYGLEQKAREMGWKETVVVDQDLGRSASGSARRAGFEQMLAEVCKGTVGAVFAVEASRLARNGREWHTLLELCGFMQTLIVDHDGVYDPRHPNDRLLLGMKGTISEMELTLIWQRSHEALQQKARRGELLTSVAIGYVKTTDDRVEKDPDRRVQDAISLVFPKFRQLGSVRQLLLWYRHEKLTLPAIEYPRGVRQIVWKLPVYNTLHAILTNPIYAGAYAFGRTFTLRRLEAGKKRVLHGSRRSQQEWPVLLKDHHEAYVAWEEFQLHQRLIAENANMKGTMTRSSVGRGPALLAGLLRCGHCGRKLHVCYSGTAGTVARYGCRGASVNHGEANCISLGALRVDRVIEEAVLEVLSPLGVEASLEAVRDARGKAMELRHQKELALRQARYEADRARRQYELVDPENRLVAAELEHRWEDRLRAATQIEREIAELPACEGELREDDIRRLKALGSDIAAVWWDPQADRTLKKRIVRAAIREIILSIKDGVVNAVIHWEGGDHTRVVFRKNKTGSHRWSTDKETEQLIRELARVTSDRNIAMLLNRMGKKTVHNHPWTQSRVASLRNSRGIAVYRPGERAERGELIGEEAARELGLSRLQLYKLIWTGILGARQCCKGAPWIIRRADLESLREKAAIGKTGAPAARPCSDGQQKLSFDGIKA